MSIPDQTEEDVRLIRKAAAGRAKTSADGLIMGGTVALSIAAVTLLLLLYFLFSNQFANPGVGITASCVTLIIVLLTIAGAVAIFGGFKRKSNAIQTLAAIEKESQADNSIASTKAGGEGFEPP